MENCLPISIVVVGITIMLISVGIFLFKYKPNRNIKTHEEIIKNYITQWQMSTTPDFNKRVYNSTLNAMSALEAKETKMNNRFKIGDTVVVVISDEKYKGKIVKVKKDIFIYYVLINCISKI